MWLYELFLLPPDTSSEAYGPREVQLPDGEGVEVVGEYSFGTEGTDVSIRVIGEGWSGKLKVLDITGVSGEVKRIEDLQEFSLEVRRGDYGAVGGILSRDLLTGRTKGEGVELRGKDARVLYMRKYAPIHRSNLTLTGNYPGPYVFSDRPVVGSSVRAYINGRPLGKREYSLTPEGNSIFLKTDFRDGDLLTVEYQTASLSPSNVVSVGFAGPLSLETYYEKPAVRVMNGCTVVSEGDYLLRGDTFLLVPGRGNLSCTFVPSEGGEYAFLGDRYVPRKGGGYSLVPPDTSPTSILGRLALRSSFGTLSITGGRMGDSLSYGGRWDLSFGSSLRIFTSGDLFKGRRPDVPSYNGGRWGKSFGVMSVGASYSRRGVALNGRVSAGVGGRIEPGGSLSGRYGWVFGEYARYPEAVFGTLGVGNDTLAVAYEFYGDTSNGYRGGKVRWRWLKANVRGYGDGFLGYALEVEGPKAHLLYSITPRGRSLMGRVGVSLGDVRLKTSVRSSQSFVRQERFVYVGKGWGDYERDSSGNFFPYPYGSYRREVVYYPTEEPSYEATLTLSGRGYGADTYGKVGRSLEKYSLSLYASGEAYNLRARRALDLTSSYPYAENSVRGRVGKPAYFKGDYLWRLYGSDSVSYITGEVGYSFGALDLGVEGLRGRTYAISPILRLRGDVSAEMGYRLFFGEPGTEVRYKPPGPFLQLTLSLRKEVKGVVISGSLIGGYDGTRKVFYSFSFGVSGGIG